MIKTKLNAKAARRTMQRNPTPARIIGKLTIATILVIAAKTARMSALWMSNERKYK